MVKKQLTKNIIIYIFLCLFINCKKLKKLDSFKLEPSVSLVNAFIKIDTNSFRKIKVKDVINIKEDSIDNRLFSYLKIENDTIMFYFDADNPNKYDRKYIRNGKVLNFLTFNNIENADSIDFYEPFYSRFKGNEFYKDKFENILIKSDMLWGTFDNGFRMIQLLTKTDCIEYLELTSTNSGRYPNKEYYDNRIIKK